MLLEMSIFLCHAKIHFFSRHCYFESGHGVGTRSSIPRLRVAQSTKKTCCGFLFFHVLYIMILIFCCKNFPKCKGIIEIDWTAHESLLCLGTYFELEKYLLIEN